MFDSKSAVELFAKSDLAWRMCEEVATMYGHEMDFHATHILVGMDDRLSAQD